MDTELQPKSKSRAFMQMLDDVVTGDEIAEVLQQFLTLIREAMSQMEEKMAQNKGEIDADHKAMYSEMESMETRIKDMHTEMTSKMGVDMKDCREQIKGLVNNLEALRGEIPEEVDLSDIWNKLKEVEAKIPEMPEKTDLTPINENIESLKAELDKANKEIEELKRRPIGGGGGTSAMAVARAFKYIFKTETPSGTIDGANTSFTVQNNIWAIVSIELNGEVYPSTGYSFINHTITFTVAPPAAYSGKDFICKYIAS